MSFTNQSGYLIKIKFLKFLNQINMKLILAFLMSTASKAIHLKFVSNPVTAQHFKQII